MSSQEVEDIISRLEAIQVEEQDLLQQLRHARNAEARARESPLIYRRGARIFITNTITTSQGRRTTSINDRRAYITRITGNRIYFRTVNGHHTWRAKSNIRLVPESEDWSNDSH